MERLYTTREVAEMWNVSPSTIKRWADTGSLCCQRTPGGHRKFSMREILEFQSRQGFEATGLLSTENWEHPEIELAVNQKKFDQLRKEILRLAIQNQRTPVKHVLERLYIRGLDICDLYDEILLPIVHEAQTQNKAVTTGHLRLLLNNLDEAILYLFPQVTHRKPNRKIAICGSPNDLNRLQVNAMTRILEVEGWDAFNLGDALPLESMAELVKEEPVDLVCVTSSHLEDVETASASFQKLTEVTHPYRIPILLGGEAFASKKERKRFAGARYVKSCRIFRRHAVGLQ